MNDKADMVLLRTPEPPENTVFVISGYPVLASGNRPYEDLQFSTVLPAVRKLNRLLAAEDVESLVEKVRAGESAMSATRTFFMDRRWI